MKSKLYMMKKSIKSMCIAGLLLLLLSSCDLLKGKKEDIGEPGTRIKTIEYTPNAVVIDAAYGAIYGGGTWYKVVDEDVSPLTLITIWAVGNPDYAPAFADTLTSLCLQQYHVMNGYQHLNHGGGPPSQYKGYLIKVQQ